MVDAMMRVLLIAALFSPFAETRQCGKVWRDLNGRIARRSDVLTAFRKLYPCPVTQKTSGACAGWSIDHVIPLACGGCDAVRNLQWLPTGSKSTSSPLAKDRFERRIYCGRS